MRTITLNRDLILRGFGLIVAAAAALLLLACGGVDHAQQIEKHKRLAGELTSNGLYQAAIDEYEQILRFDDLTDEQRGNINYLVARLYYQSLQDYRAAAAHYIRAKEYAPDGSFAAEATKSLVASLEKFGNVLDARRQLEAATDIDHKAADASDVVVARIGDRDIWLSEVEARIAQLPREYQSQLAGREAKIQYIRQYVGVELLYNAAVREDYLSDPQVQRERDRMIRTMLVDRFVADKVVPAGTVDTLDVRNFYRAHKDSLYNGTAYDSVRAQVYRDYQTQKAEIAYNEYIQKLAAAERVEFLDQNVK